MTSPLIPSTPACNGGKPPGSGGCDSVSSQVYWNGNLWIWPWAEDVDWCSWSSPAFSCDPINTDLDHDNYSPSGFPGGSITLSVNPSDSNPLYDTGLIWAIVTPTQAANYTRPDSSPDDYKGVIKVYWTKVAPGGSGTPDFTMPLIWHASPESFHTSIFALPNGSKRRALRTNL